MLGIAEDIIVAISMAALLLWFMEDEAWYYGATQVASQLFFVGDAMWHHAAVAAAINMACAMIWVFWTWHAWKNRKNRKKRKLLSRAGYKGRAALLKLVKAMPRPRMPRIRIPVPVPG